MKKHFLLLVAAIIGSTGVFAQSSLLATLSHEGEISTFYGASALKEAHEAAVSGDVITLSSGSFVATNITKAITLRGAGMGIDSTAIQKDATIIMGEFNFELSDEETNRLTIEGIYNDNTIYYSGNLNNATFLKCRFKTLNSRNSETSHLKDASFIHCRITDDLLLSDNSSVLCIGSVIGRPYSYYDKASNFELVNCIIKNCEHMSSSSIKNSIIINNATLNSTITAYNCIGFSKNGNNIFGSHIYPYSTNVMVEDMSYVFTTFTQSSEGENLQGFDLERFTLTDEAQAKYLGNDKTQVGIYGGSFPYSPNPTNPQIVKCDVASHSTADGKLSVDLQVATAE